MTYSTPRHAVRVSALAFLIAAFVCALARPWVHAQGLPATGGFVELATSAGVRPPLTIDDLQALLPARGPFTFPAPYGTAGVRLTNADDCGGWADCVQPFGGPAWSHINNSTGSNFLYAVVGLDRSRGGTGPTLFRIDKTSGDTVNLGPLFDEGDDLSLSDASTWYFSATQPTTIYIGVDTWLRRRDVLTRASSLVFDVSAEFGDDKQIWDPRSSSDDRVHSFGLASATNGQALGCGVYREDTHQFSWFPAVGTFLECEVDRSGHWLVIKEDQSGLGGVDNRIADLDTGALTTVLDADGAANRSDRLFGGILAANDHQALPNVIRPWSFGPLAPGAAVYHDLAGQSPSFTNISSANARWAPLDRQFACGSSVNRTNGPRANEVVCAQLDGSLRTLVVAPTMADLDAAGGGADEMDKAPVGTLDPTGQYFLWTSNAIGARLDAFLVRVPSALLVTPPADITAPAIALTSPAQAATVAGATLLTAAASDDTGVAGVQFRLDGANLGTELTVPPFAWTWNTATASDGTHVLTAIARDAAGNRAAAAPVSVTVLNASAAPQISGVSASNITETRALISWVTNQLADGLVEYGPTAAYGASTALNPALSGTHLQLLTGLTGGTTYHYRVTSWNAQGLAATSSDLTFATDVPLVIGGLGASSPGTSAVIGWTTNLPASSQVEYGLTTDYGDATDMDESLTVFHGLTISGLAPGTGYHYRVYSVTVAGALAVSPDATFLTPGRPDGPGTVAPGGFVESATAANTRARPSAAALQALVPARGVFTLPAPYGTTAVRLTNHTDCGGGDCVSAPGGGHWQNLSNSTGSSVLYAVLGLDKGHGGTGATVFRVDKTTQEVTNLGPLFGEGDDMAWSDAAGWYFSGTQPTTYYVSVDRQLRRYDVVTHASSVVFDITATFGPDREILQAHSSHDDRVHSFTLRRTTDLEVLGCGVYREDTQRFAYFPAQAAFRECRVDRSGRWLLITEGAGADQDRIVDLLTGTSTALTSAQAADGDVDLGFGMMVAIDKLAGLPNALRSWAFGPTAPGPVVYHDAQAIPRSFTQISFANARSAPPDQQYACGSAVDRTNGPRANEIVCARLDGSLSTLVVAPVMTDLDAPGGATEANKYPNGNLDPTGQYFLWTSNLMGSRLDAYLVRVPSQLLVTPPVDTTAPTVAITAPAPTATVSGTAALSAAASDFTGVAGVQFQIDGVNLGAEITTAPYAWLWNTTTASDGVHELTAIARDAAGNTALSVPVAVTVLNSPAPPAITGVTASPVTSSTALITWTTNQLADSNVEFGPTAAYGSSTGTAAALTGAHLQLLAGLSAGSTYHYRVTSTNAQGATASSADVTFTTTGPPVITAVGVSSALPTSALVSWTTDLAATSQVEYGRTTAYGDATDIAPALVNAHGLTLSGLTMGTQYHFRVYSVSQAGVSSVSNDFTFATANYPVISQVGATSVTGVSATIGWATDVPASSQAEYGLTTAYGSTTPLDATLVTTHGRQLTGLTAGLTYHYRVTSTSGAGLPAVSGDGTLTTPLPAGPAPVVWTNLVNADVTGAVLQKSGGCDGCADASASSLQYISGGDGYVEFTVTEFTHVRDVDLSHTVPGAPAGNLSFEWRVFGSYAEVRENGIYRIDTPLAVNDVLRIAIVGGAVEYLKNGATLYTSGIAPAYPLGMNAWLSSAGATVTNALIKGDALVPTPPAISNVAASNVTAASATVTWRTDQGADSQVEYGLTTAYGSLTPRVATLVSAHSVLVSGLAREATYHYRARSTNAQGLAVASGDLTVTTGAGAAISNLGAVSVTSAIVTIGWNTDQPATSRIEYGLTTDYGDATPLDPTLTVTHLQTLGGLSPGQTYHYRALADASEVTTASADLTFTTPALPGPAPVAWTNLLNMTVTGGVLKKAAGCEGCADAEATSLQHVSSGDGYVEFSVKATTTSASVGLIGPSGSGAVFTFSVQGTYAEVRESGDVYRTDTPIAVNDVLRVAVVGGVVHYSRNGTVFYTSAAAPVYPLHVDAWLLHLGSTVDNAIILGDAVVPPPAISGVGASGITSSSATISWVTDQPATSRIEYGLTSAYDASTTVDQMFVGAHGQTLTGLQAGATYHYRVWSMNVQGLLVASGDFTFTTSSAPGSP